MAFHGTPNGNDDVNHINGNRQDNRASNLEWCTRSHNQLHRHHEINDVLGDVKLRRGEASGMSKLTAKMISDAREMRANGQTYIAIARHFSVHETTIFLALKRKTWKHL